MREMQMQAATAKTKGNNTFRVSNIRSSRAFTNTENSPGVRGLGLPLESASILSFGTLGNS